MKQAKAFKKPKKGQRIEYTKAVMDAVLDINKTIQCLVINDGYDWIDQRHGYIKLLISRGQVLKVITNSDLMAHDDYLAAIESGVTRSYSFECNFQVGTGPACASAKRMDKAHLKYLNFIHCELPEKRRAHETELEVLAGAQ